MNDIDLTHQIKSYATSTNYSETISNEKDVWYDTIDWVEIDDEWFDASDGGDASTNTQYEAMADDVPFSEDCRRGLHCFITTLANHGQACLLSSCISLILPKLPVNIYTLAEQLYSAIVKNERIDEAILHSLGLISYNLPENINIISYLASGIRDVITGWASDTVMQPFIDEDSSYYNGMLFTALAITTIAAKRCMTDNGMPQRPILKVPAFIAGLFIKAGRYLNYLNYMDRRKDTTGNTNLTRVLNEPPALEVDTVIELNKGTHKRNDTLRFDSDKEVTSLSSNATVNYDLLTKATVLNNPNIQSQKGKGNIDYVHEIAVRQLMEKGGLSGVDYCTTKKTETKNILHDNEIINIHYNSKCDATSHPEPLEKTGCDVSYEDFNNKDVRSVSDIRGEGFSPLTAAVTVAVTASTIVSPRAQTTTAGPAAILASVIAGIGLLSDGVGARKNMGRVGLYSDSLKIATSDEAAKKLCKNLKKLNIIDNSEKTERIPKESIAAGIANLLYVFDEHTKCTRNDTDKRFIEAAKMILKSHSHVRDNISLSTRQSEAVVRRWLSETFLGTTFDDYLVDRMANITHPEQFNIDNLAGFVNYRNLSEKKVIKDNVLSNARHGVLFTLWDNMVDSVIPFRKYLDSDIKLSNDDVRRVGSLNVTDDEFVWLHIGSLLLRDSGGDTNDFSADECINIGKIFCEQATLDSVSLSGIRYLILPSLLHSYFFGTAKKRKVDMGITRDILVINEYLEHRGILNRYLSDFNSKVKKFSDLSKQWLTRDKIADQYIGKCSDDTLIKKGAAMPPDHVIVPGQYPQNYSYEQKLARGKDEVRELYLDGIKIEGCPDADVTAEFTKNTALLADAFADTEEFYIAASLARLSKDELTFINDANAKYHQFKPQMYTFKTRRTHGAFKKIDIPLKNDKIFSVTVGNEERVYLFDINHSRTNDEYNVLRIDRVPGNYIKENLFFDKINRKYVVVGDGELKFEGKDNIYYLSFDKTKEAELGDDLLQLVKKTRRNEYYNMMYDAGYSISASEKIWETVKHFIPFYDCATNKFPENLASCVLDILSFAPVAGQAIGLGSRFGIGLVRGGVMGMKIAKKGVQINHVINAIKIGTPKIRDIASLAKNTIRTLDPGIEMVFNTRKLLSNLHEWHKARHSTILGDDLGGIINRLPKDNTSIDVNPIKFGRISGTNSWVKVKKVGVVNNKEIYMMLDDVTGDLYGERYLLTKKKKLVVAGSKYGQVVSQWKVKDNISGRLDWKLKFSDNIIFGNADDISIDLNSNRRIYCDNEKPKKYYIRRDDKYILITKSTGFDDRYSIKLSSGGQIHIRYRPLGYFDLESVNEFYHVYKKTGLGKTNNKPKRERAIEVLANVPGLDEQSARKLLDEFEFKPKGPHDVYAFSNYVSTHEGELPDWASRYRIKPLGDSLFDHIPSSSTSVVDINIDVAKKINAPILTINQVPLDGVTILRNSHSYKKKIYVMAHTVIRPGVVDEPAYKARNKMIYYCKDKTPLAVSYYDVASGASALSQDGVVPVGAITSDYKLSAPNLISDQNKKLSTEESIEQIQKAFSRNYDSDFDIAFIPDDSWVRVSDLLSTINNSHEYDEVHCLFCRGHSLEEHLAYAQ